MTFHSTRDASIHVSASQALLQGMAPQGGLFVPSHFPQLNLLQLRGKSYQEMALNILGEYLDLPEGELRQAIDKAYQSFPQEVCPLQILEDGAILELFHGKTLAFKDMALSLLPELMTLAAADKKFFIVTATSGDTGKAALEAFQDHDSFYVVVFFPEEGVSAIQKLQMVTQPGTNLKVIGLAGNFDQAQKTVKALFLDPEFQALLQEKGWCLSSANSINIARLLSQIVYYYHAYLRLLEKGRLAESESLDIVVPTGNFGNVLAAIYAKAMGLPLGKIAVASNANDVLTDFFQEGHYVAKRPLLKTSSPSMDILVSSNLERFLHLLCRDEGYIQKLYKDLREKGEFHWELGFPDWLLSDRLSEEEVKQSIKTLYHDQGYLLDPHSAVAYGVAQKLKLKNYLVVSTASPFKFPELIFEALHEDIPESLQGQLEALSQLYGRPIPPQLVGIHTKKRRHQTVLEPAEARSNILGILEEL